MPKSPISYLLRSERDYAARARRPARTSSAGGARRATPRAAAHRARIGHLHGLLRHPVHDHEAAPSAAARQGRDYAAVVDQVFLPPRRWSTIYGPNCCGCARRAARALRSDLLRRLMVRFHFPLLRALRQRPGLARGGGARQEARDRRACAGTFRRRPRAVPETARHREERLKPRDMEPVALLAAYMQGISVVIDAVDRLEK